MCAQSNTSTTTILNYLFFLLILSLLFHFLEPITWKNAPEHQQPVVGQNYVVRCEVTANPGPRINWLRNGDPVCIYCVSH